MSALFRPTRAATALGLFAAAISIGAVGAAPAAAMRVRVFSHTFSLSRSAENHSARLSARCRRGSTPVGGGMYSPQGVAPNGTGVYPMSSERLGFQGGWTSTATLYNPALAPTPARDAVMQVFCTKVQGKVSPVLTPTLVDAGADATTVAQCPPGTTLLSGGYLTDYFYPGNGVYVTESKRSNDSSWEVTGYATAGGHGGYITALAYCLSTRRKTLSEVSATATVTGPGQTATAVTPSCPAGHPLVLGGYSGPAKGALLFFNPSRTPAGSWSVSAYGLLGKGQFTAYGYCVLRARGALGNGRRATIFTAPITTSNVHQPPSPHGPTFTVMVEGSSQGKLGSRRHASHSAPVRACNAHRPITLTPKYRNGTTPSASAGAPVVTTTDANGRFSAEVQVTVPNPPYGNQISVPATFESYAKRRVGGKAVTCEPGGPLYPAWYSVGS